MFYIGQRVVYVGKVLTGEEKQYRLENPYTGDWPVKDVVYTISGIHHHQDVVYPYSISIVGLYSPKCDSWYIGYDPRGFRPVCDRKTDITVFTNLLKPVDELV